jgi:hypothetical protein
MPQYASGKIERNSHLGPLPETSSYQFDKELKDIEKLSWLPWVGERYADSPPGGRILIVGESHYMPETASAEDWEKIKRSMSSREHTRAAIQESVIRQEWTNKTFKAIPRLVLGGDPKNRVQFWGSVAYHNLIQRVMRYGAAPERPSHADIDAGWRGFARVVGTLAPDLVIVLGSSGAARFSPCMDALHVPHNYQPRVAKIGRCWAYAGDVTVENKRTPLVFTRHPSQFFNWRAWHVYIASRHPNVLRGLKSTLAR